MSHPFVITVVLGFGALTMSACSTESSSESGSLDDAQGFDVIPTGNDAVDVHPTDIAEDAGAVDVPSVDVLPEADASEVDASEVDASEVDASEVDASEVDIIMPSGWASGEPLPISVTENSAVTLGNSIYVMGGFVGFESPATVHRFDGETAEWSAVTPLPREGFHHLSVVAADEKLWLVAGLETIGFSPSATSYSYDPSNDQWAEIAAPLLPRGAAGAAEIDGVIYVAGGLTPTGASNTLMSYTLATDSWDELTPMDVAREHIGACALNGKLHVFGGRLGGLNNHDTHRVYDPSLDEWSSAEPLPTARSGVGVVRLNGRCHVFGGEESAGTFGQHEVWSDADGWSTLTEMPTPRHGLGAAVLNGQI
ncbi:MAG: hypothetical protein ACI9OJ_002863, partial [Myxococcota bacterium]